jgi:hypothetical protein
MATPPTFVAEYEAVWNSNSSPRTQSVTVAADDVLVVLAVSEDASTTLATPSGGGLTYTLRQSVVVSSYTTAYVWTAQSATSQTFDVSITASGGGQFGFNVLRFSGSDGIGGSSKTNVASGAPSLAITTTGANSAVMSISGDWAAVDGTSRTWRTVNGITPTSGNGGERTYHRDSAHYAVYAAYWSDAGAAGSKTVGVSAPSGQKYAIVAVEVLGTAGSSTPISVGDAGGGADSVTVAAAAALADAAAGGEALTAAVAAAAADAGSAADSAAVAAATPLADAASAGDALSATVAVSLADGGSAADSVNNGLGTNKSLADAGAGTDALAVSAAVALPDAGAATQTFTTAAAVPLAQAAAGSDALTTPTRTVLLADTASSAESLAVLVALALADAGAAVDSATGYAGAFNQPGQLASSITAARQTHGVTAAKQALDAAAADLATSTWP